MSIFDKIPTAIIDNIQVVLPTHLDDSLKAMPIDSDGWIVNSDMIVDNEGNCWLDLYTAVWDESEDDDEDDANYDNWMIRVIRNENGYSIQYPEGTTWTPKNNSPDEYKASPSQYAPVIKLEEYQPTE